MTNGIVTGIHEFVERWGLTAVLVGTVSGLLTLVIVPLWDGTELVRRAAYAFALGVLLGLDYGIVVEWRTRESNSDDRRED